MEIEKAAEQVTGTEAAALVPLQERSNRSAAPLSPRFRAALHLIIGKLCGPCAFKVADSASFSFFILGSGSKTFS